VIVWSREAPSAMKLRLHSGVLSINGTGSAPVPINAWPDNTTSLKQRLLVEGDSIGQHRDLLAPNRAFSPERPSFKSRSRGRSLNRRMPIGDGHLDVLHATGV
jgi:hypothetical protein